MNLILILFMGLPQDYMNLVLNGEYEEALVFCESMISQGKDIYEWTLEQSDIYLDKINDYEKAAVLYQQLIDQYPKKNGWLHYRLAIALELSEDFLGSAKSYEVVATQFRKEPLDSFALSGVERCFKKNYQDYVATVNGQTVTRLEFDEFLSQMSPFAKKDPHAMLDQMILPILLHQSAIEHDVHHTELFKQFMRQGRGYQLLDEVYTTQVMAKALPTEKQMKKYYKKNKENYLVREQLRGKEIIVGSDSLAQVLLDSLKKDIASFDTVAKMHSTAATARNGGYMGIVYKEVRPQPVDNALFKAKVNTIVGVIEHENEYGIYMVTEHRPARYRDFDEVKSQIETNLKAENLKDVETEFMEDLREDAQITIYDEVIADTSESSGEAVVAKINGREITKSAVFSRNETQPQFGRVDPSQPDQFNELLKVMLDGELKLEFGERNKYFLYDGYIVKMQQEWLKLLENGLYRTIVVEAVTIDSSAVRAYYDEHKNEFIIPESVTAKEIVVYSQAQAIGLRQQLLKNPESFDSLAIEHSKSITASRGGLTGAIRRGMRPKVFEDIAFTIDIGAISEIFTTDDTTFNVITVIERVPTSYRTFEEVKSSIETTLIRREQRVVADAFLEKIRENASIEIFLEKPEEKSEGENEETQ